MKKHTDNSEQRRKDTPCAKLKRAGQAYRDGYTCSQAVFLVYAQEMGIDEIKACRMMEGFGAGIGGSQGICGALVAATAIISYFSSDGLSGNDNRRAELYEKARAALTAFEKEYGGITCKQVLHGCSPDDFPCGMKVKDMVLIISRILEKT